MDFAEGSVSRKPPGPHFRPRFYILWTPSGLRLRSTRTALRGYIAAASLRRPRPAPAPHHPTPASPEARRVPLTVLGGDRVDEVVQEVDALLHRGLVARPNDEVERGGLLPPLDHLAGAERERDVGEARDVEDVCVFGAAQRIAQPRQPGCRRTGGGSGGKGKQEGVR